jgi:hypothetical protein
LTPAEVAANDHGLEVTTLADERCELEQVQPVVRCPLVTRQMLIAEMHDFHMMLTEYHVTQINEYLERIQSRRTPGHVVKNLSGVLFCAMLDGLKNRVESDV